MTVYERLDFLAKGGRKDYTHKLKENKKVTRLQDFLSAVSTFEDSSVTDSASVGQTGK